MGLSGLVITEVVLNVDGQLEIRRSGLKDLHKLSHCGDIPNMKS